MDVNLTSGVTAALQGLKAANSTYQQLIEGIVEAVSPDSTSSDVPVDTVDISSLAAALSSADQASASVELNAKLLQKTEALNSRVLDLIA